MSDPRVGERVELFKGHDGQWFFRRVAANNEPVGGSGGEGYHHFGDAEGQARSNYPGVPVFVEDESGEWGRHQAAQTDDVVRVLLGEHVVEGLRLGRHVEHDPRSRNYAWEVPAGAAGALVAVEHVRHGGIFNQGQLGSCTGNAACGAKNIEPLYHLGSSHLIYESGAVDVYSLATRLDGLTDGYYPPTDTGSSGLAVAKAMKQLGMIGSYAHAFDMAAALSALQSQPVITGVPWYEGFDHPDANGLIQIAGQVRGGHEIVARGYQPGQAADGSDALVKFDNSWGTTYGQHGSFFMSVATWQKLLDAQGDVTILLP